jgi:hypothetical protein
MNLQPDMKNVLETRSLRRLNLFEQVSGISRRIHSVAK